ncbi:MULTISPECIES: type III glutamate--ammonia ligase [Pseudonocardia]|uniref:Glutamine synthetase 3 n=2 Tax=Pseudonocardia TaxID=1847 RepID=A0A1Y2MR84_PSEAH|nr:MULTISPECIES: type III glutamate--ammonia ligase [Pseudonocardia]OSY37720.1 Glutamine synthetase 3 [Pseudonocardia autotrophica]BBF99761.1 glutamine synthetase [Pseudonocardia autotrophica]GEC27097.1 glutamine synthetase [Pseudonocardia saturnea]
MADKTESLEEVRRVVEDNDIEFIFASFSEVRGKSSAKLVPVSQLDTLFGAGVGFAGYAAGEIGQGPHSPDIELIPDPATLRIVPWRPGLAHLIGDARVDGGSWPYCPRSILRRQIARAAELGYEFRIGFEAEFMLVDHDENGKLVVADRHDTWPKPCYDVKGLTRQYDFVTQLSRYVTGLGWENYAVDHEDANGQFECNVTFADALETADRAVFFRYMVETVAQQHDMIATFMPKPFTDNTGNGFHYTMSLWDPETETNLFEDPQDPLGLSQLGYRFAAGILDHARGYAAMVAPTVNSYKRMKAGTDAIRTWVPVAMAYGGNNRTQMLRIARPGAIEDRTPDFSGSPYLGFAAALAAGLDGIERNLQVGEPNTANLYEYSPRQLRERGLGLLPGSLLEAVHYLEKDDVLRSAFGTVPVDRADAPGEVEDFVDYYARLKRDEFHAVNDVVAQHEVDRYLQFP